LSTAIDTIAPKLLKLEGPFDRLGAKLGGAIERIANLLASGPWQDAFKRFINTASRLIEPMTTTFISIGNVMRDIATAALPLVEEAVKGVADWFDRLDRKATRSKIREVVLGLVDHTKTWFNLFRELGKLMGAVFGTGGDQAQSFVESWSAGSASW
jgi:hypothetical protein